MPFATYYKENYIYNFIYIYNLNCYAVKQVHFALERCRIQYRQDYSIMNYKSSFELTRLRFQEKKENAYC